MRFIVSSGELLKALQLVGSVIINNPTMSILENFLFELSDGELTITGSDAETTLQTSISVESQDEGKLAVPAKMLLEVLKTFSEQPLTFKKQDSILEIIDETDNYFINLDDTEIYPSIPEIYDSSEVVFTGGVLSNAINKTIFATGNDAIRPIMTGVLFQINDQQCNIVATDAHRLVKYSINDITSEEPIDLIIPKKPLNLLRNSLADSEEQVKIEFNQTNAKFTHKNTIWICRLIDGKYPNYNAVIPTENPNVLTINTSVFSNAVKRASFFANKSTHQVRLSIQGNSMRISAEDTSFNNKADMVLPCDYSGEDITIGFNSKFLLEMLSHLDSEDLTLEMSAPNRAGIIKPIDGLEENQEILMLVMPVMA
ncbi:MAG: DNA polymerase III subunit beta [Flavobacteriales bacterium]|nr:DNA polymerase III subunit beta [Flavobacteriales bacterium]